MWNCGKKVVGEKLVNKYNLHTNEHRRDPHSDTIMIRHRQTPTNTHTPTHVEPPTLPNLLQAYR
jgi:hypothetical protein